MEADLELTHEGREYFTSCPDDLKVKDICPTCGRQLEYFSGMIGIPAHLFCPRCVDWAYDPETGERLARMI